MVDVEALLADSATDPARCQTCNWLKARPADERKKWEEAVDQPKTFPAVVVSRAMAKVEPTEKNHPPSPTEGSIRNHRGGHGKGNGRGR